MATAAVATTSGVYMRPPRVTRISTESYAEEYWPKISQVLTQILFCPQQPVSQEELYRTIYNVCCQRHNVALYNDLMRLVTEHLERMREVLLNTSEYAFLETFAQQFVRFRKACDVICIGFKYLERVYLTEKLNTNLTKALQDKFLSVVLEPTDIPAHIRGRLQHCFRQVPLPLDPSLSMNLIKGLHAMHKDYANMNPELFALFIPCLRPTRSWDEDLQEAREHVARLRNQHFPRGLGELKRKYDDTLTT